MLSSVSSVIDITFPDNTSGYNIPYFALTDQSDGNIASNDTGTPSFTASRLGQLYVDTSNNQAYISIDTGSSPASADWKQITS